MNEAKAIRYRALAEECGRQAQLAFAEPEFRAMQQRLSRAYAALAEVEEWLEGDAATGGRAAQPDFRRARRAA